MPVMVNVVVRAPEPLRKQARAVAVLRGEHLSDIVRTALEEYIEDALDDAKDNREMDELERRIDAGLEPLYKHADVWAEIEALEAKGALPD